MLFPRIVTLSNKTEMIIRPARPGDARKIVQYLNEVRGSTDYVPSIDDLSELSIEDEVHFINKIQDDPNALMIIGLISGGVVSIARITSFHRLKTAHNAELSISVSKDHWNLNIGSNMLKIMIQFARENQLIENISLGVIEDNSGGIRMYEKFGFERVGVHKDFFNIRGKYYDEILMDLNLYQ